MTSSDTQQQASAAPVDRLRAAAGVVREASAAVRSEDWADRPWHVEQCADEDLGECACIVAQGENLPFDQPQIPPIRYVADAETPELAGWIALMSPVVGELLAAWLERAAHSHEATLIAAGKTWASVMDPRAVAFVEHMTNTEALAVADQILAAVSR